MQVEKQLFITIAKSPKRLQQFNQVIIIMECTLMAISLL